MRGLNGVVSKLAWIPVVAFLAAGCVPVSSEQANLQLQSQMGWNAEKQLELNKQAKALAILFIALDRTTRSYFAGFFTDGGA